MFMYEAKIKEKKNVNDLNMLAKRFQFHFFFLYSKEWKNYTKFYFFEWKTVILIEFNDNETKYKFYMDDTIIMRNSFHVYTYK